MTGKSIPTIHTLTTMDWIDYQLLDSGDGLKLEQFGNYVFIRPEAQAIWKPAYPISYWNKADAVFQTTGEENGGHWKTIKPLTENWLMTYRNLTFKAQTGPSRHLGVFPEQAVHWDWTANLITASKRPIKVLNLFGYTGLASLAVAGAGAQVTHVDASKKVVAWAKENQTLSNMDQLPVRWIIDDALKFVERETRRTSFYDGIILDPPKFGRGPKGEVWEFFKLLPQLLETCKSLLSSNPLFMVVTAYAVKSSALTLHGAVTDLVERKGGKVEVGELVTLEKSAGRVISNAIYARWSVE